jgi:hypothetical protein
VDQLDVARITEVFLVPTSILIGAFSFASTEQLKTALSSMCIVIAAMWLTCVFDALPLAATLRVRVLAALPILVLFVSLIATIIHAKSWWQLKK